MKGFLGAPCSCPLRRHVSAWQHAITPRNHSADDPVRQGSVRRRHDISTSGFDPLATTARHAMQAFGIIVGDTLSRAF